MNPPAIEEKAPLSPWLVIAVGIAAVSTASIFIRFAQKDASSLTVAAYRLTIASLILLPVTITRHREELRQVKRRDLFFLIGTGVVLGLHFASWISSLEYTSVATSVVLVTTTPLWVALFSPFLLHEKLPKGIWLGLALALGGGIIVSLNDACSLGPGLNFTCSGFDGLLGQRSLLGNGLALVGALCAAAYMLAGRRYRASLSIEVYTFIVYGSAAVALLLACALTSQRMIGFPPVTYIWFVALALAPQLLGHSSFNWALKYLPAATVSITLLGEPIGSAILAYFILAEHPGALELAGGVLILLGIYICSRGK
jgi:drug/metabolite transporter (DMT)-like permease